MPHGRRAKIGTAANAGETEDTPAAPPADPPPVPAPAEEHLGPNRSMLGQSSSGKSLRTARRSGRPPHRHGAYQGPRRLRLGRPGARSQAPSRKRYASKRNDFHKVKLEIKDRDAQQEPGTHADPHHLVARQKHLGRMSRLFHHDLVGVTQYAVNDRNHRDGHGRVMLPADGEQRVGQDGQGRRDVEDHVDVSRIVLAKHGAKRAGGVPQVVQFAARLPKPRTAPGKTCTG